MKIFKRENLDGFLLAGVLLFFVISHIVYISQTNVYVSGDQHQYVTIAIRYLKIFQNPNLFMFGDILDASFHRPPIYPLLVSFSFALFGLKNPTLYGPLVNSIFLLILGFSIYGISYYFFNNKLISLVSVFIGLSYPLLLIYSRVTMTELPLTALIALTALFLLKSNMFENNKFLYLASIAFGFSLLTRWTAGFYLFGPVVFMSLVYISKNGLNDIFKKFIPAIIFGLAIPLVFYIHNFVPFTKYVFLNTTHGASWSPHAQLSIESILWYPLDLGEVLSIYLFIILVIGFFIGLLNFKKYIFLYLWIIISYIMFTFIVSFKADRFIMPIYPALAVISVIPLYKLRTYKYFNILVLITIGLALSIFIYTSWNIGPFSQFSHKNVSFFEKRIRYSNLPYSRPPKRNFYNSDALFAVLDTDYKKMNIENPKILFTISIENINKDMYQHIRYETLEKLSYLTLVGQDKNYFEIKLKEADYVVAKDGEVIDKHHPIERVEPIRVYNRIFLELVESSNDFEKIAEDKYLDGEVIYLFKRVRR